MKTIKRFYINGNFPISLRFGRFGFSFNLYAKWNEFIYMLYRNRKSDVPVLISCFILTTLLMLVIWR